MDTFFLDSTEMISCTLPPGMYTVEEIPPPGILPDIRCRGKPSAETPTSVTFDIVDGHSFRCTFTNSEVGGRNNGNNTCSSSLAGPGQISDLSDLLGLIVVPFIVILGRRFTKCATKKAGTK